MIPGKTLLQAFPLLWLFICNTFPLGLLGAPIPQKQNVIEPLDYRGVTIDSGILKDQLDQVSRYYLAIPNDDLLKGFRARAGLPAPGKDLGGWYGRDVFHVFGQIVSGLSRLYAGTGNPAFREKANYLVNEWGKCIEPDGYFFFSKTPFARHYIYDKMLWGLIDNYLYCGNQEATNHLSRITDWAIKNLDRSRNVNDTAKEWYTLSENLYRAWLATGDPKYRDFAEVWEYSAYWDFYARNQDIFSIRPDGTRSDVYHAYSHVNTLGGAAMAYKAKADSRYLGILTNAFDYLQNNQVFATGGYGQDEKLLPADKFRERIELSSKSFETQCGSWAAFKLCKYLLSFTGDARYGDWVERLAINGIGASIAMSPQGNVFYYADYNLHGCVKSNIDIQWSCCTGTRPQAVADLHDLIYFKDTRNLYVNLFASSTLTCDVNGHAITVIQRTAFPEDGKVSLELRLTNPAEFGIKIRTPEWLAGPMQLNINGRNTKAKADAQHWTTLNRRWKNKDQITIRLPMKVWSSPLQTGREQPEAFLYGPTVLAFECADSAHVRDMKMKKLATDVRPVPDKALCFEISSNPGVRIRPFYSIPEGEPYFLYIDPKMGSKIPHPHLTYTGKWESHGSHHFSNEAGAAFECTFNGTGIRWLGWRYNDGGHGEISIDGKVYCIVDQYGPGRELPFDWNCSGLKPGRHTIRIKVLDEKTAPSLNRFLNVAAFEVLAE